MPHAAHREGHQQTLAELGLVSASVIHEIKSALQGIGNALLLLEHDPNLSPKARDWVASAQLELSRAVAASRQTLALVRYETPARLSITEILDEILDTYATKTAYKRISIDRQYEFNGTIEANEGAIREVFINLVLNALEAAPQSIGRLVIHTAAVTRANANPVCRQWSRHTG